MAKSWVGSIYHKFETICQEVDDLVNKDKVKVVENQVQSVGSSVKNVCSDLIHDELPPSGNDIKNDTQLLTAKQADMTDHAMSTTSIMIKSEGTNEKQLYTENCFNDSLNICNTPLGDIDLEICRKKLVSENSPVEVKTDLQLVGATVIRNDSVNDVEEETAKATMPVSSDSSSKNKVLAHVTPDMDSSNSLTLDAGEGDSRKDGSVCCSYVINDECFTDSDATQAPKLIFSNSSSDSEETRMSVTSSCHSTDSESPNVLDCLGSKNNWAAENIHNNHLLSNGRGFDVCYDTCPSSPATGSREIKAIDAVPALLIAESSDGHASTTHGRFSVGSSEGNFNICTRIDDLNLETIDLSTNVKPDFSNVNFVPTTSFRPKNFKYYKKLILDAFASRKRLSKEYELLPILYGDFEMDLKHHSEQSSLPSSKKSQLPQTSDSEWELL